MENSVNDMFKEKYVILIGDGLETLISIVLGTNGMDISLKDAIFEQKLSFSQAGKNKLKSTKCIFNGLADIYALH